MLWKLKFNVGTCSLRSTGETSEFLKPLFLEDLYMPSPFHYAPCPQPHWVRLDIQLVGRAPLKVFQILLECLTMNQPNLTQLNPIRCLLFWKKLEKSVKNFKWVLLILLFPLFCHSVLLNWVSWEVPIWSNALFPVTAWTLTGLLLSSKGRVQWFFPITYVWSF